MIPSEQVVRGFLIGPVRKTGNHLICRCWKCQKDMHYYYNIVTGMSDCKLCKVATNVFGFLQGWGRLDLLGGQQIVLDRIQKLGSQIPTEEVLDLQMKNSRLPAGFKRVHWNDSNPFTSYLKSRKYTEADFDLYQPGYTNLIDLYKDYLIIPVWRDWECKGYLVRYIGTDPEKTRYLNAKGVKFTKILEGIDECTSNTQTAILVEGHFDRISVKNELHLNDIEDYRALGTFGKKISEFQIELLKCTNIKVVYLMYDAVDAVNQIKQFGAALGKHFKVYGCFTSMLKDPGKMTGPEIISVLEGAEPIKVFSYNKVQAKILK